jgi:hypothetical protein
LDGVFPFGFVLVVLLLLFPQAGRIRKAPAIARIPRKVSGIRSRFQLAAPPNNARPMIGNGRQRAHEGLSPTTTLLGLGIGPVVLIVRFTVAGVPVTGSPVCPGG